MAKRVPLSGRESMLHAILSAWHFWTKQMDGLIRIVWGHLRANCGPNRESLSNRSADDRCAITDKRTAAVRRRLYPAHPGPA
jgi:hypothetical protein